MKLFLTSEAKHPDSLEKLEKFVGGVAGKRIVYIPTAANGEYYGSWKSGESIRVVQSLGAQVDIVELESYAYQDVIKAIGQPDILWMAGGMSGYLLYWIRRVELDKALPEILDNGTIYLGSSAGSMICAKSQDLAEWYIGESESGASLIPGLGLIDFEIYPHYEEGLKSEIEKRFTGDKIYLLKDGEVITVVDGVVEVLGEERVLKK